MFMGMKFTQYNDKIYVNKGTVPERVNTNICNPSLGNYYVRHYFLQSNVFSYSFLSMVIAIQFTMAHNEHQLRYFALTEHTVTN